MAAGNRCNPIETFEFASVADKPFQMDWTEWLDGATIVAAAASVNGSTLLTTHDLDFTLNGSTIVEVWVHGLDVGFGEAFVTIQVTASDGRIDARSWLFNVNQPGA